MILKLIILLVDNYSRESNCYNKVAKQPKNNESEDYESED